MIVMLVSGKPLLDHKPEPGHGSGEQEDAAA